MVRGSPEGATSDTTAEKISGAAAPTGEMGQVHLASGERVAMRLWRDEPPGEAKPATRRDYETVGHVIAGRAELAVGGQVLRLGPGDSWLVPAGAEHAYRILEPFTAVEATAPPTRAD